MFKKFSKITNSAHETFELGVRIGKQLPNQIVICFFGDLAAGKTTLIKGIASGALQIQANDVNSPTFVYLNIYKSFNKTLYHFDLYRLYSCEEFFSLGFEEFLNLGICCIEWSERVSSCLPEQYLMIQLFHQDDNQREMILSESHPGLWKCSLNQLEDTHPSI